MGRRALLLTGLLLMAASGLSAQEKAEGPAVFDSREWDFGAIREADGVVTHAFLVFNAGSRPLRLERAIPGCSCISATLPRTAIAPGQSAAVEVSFTPAGAAGTVLRTVEIQADGNRSLGVLSVSADVLPADRSIQERYPVVLAQGLYASRADVNFGYLSHGERAGKAFFIANAGDAPMRLRSTAPGSGAFRVSAPATLAPGEEARVEVWCDSPADPSFYGSLRAVLELVPDGGKSLRTLPLSALCVDLGTPEGDDAPRLRTGQVRLQRKPLSRRLQGTLELANDGKSPLVIHAVELPEGFSSSFSPGTRVVPGRSVSVKLTGSPAPEGCNRPGRKASSLRCGKARPAAPSGAGSDLRMTVFSNDPLRPAKELSININHK